MVAVLRNALGCIEEHRHATDTRDRRLLDETKQWFLATDTNWPYSFECICEVLDLDANAIRQRLGVVPDPQPVAELRAGLLQG